MRFVHLYCLLALLGQTTATALVFAQGPIIDSDPAPGRSPGPPVNYSPVPLSGKKANLRRFDDKIGALQKVEGVAVASSAVVNTPSTHTPPAFISSPTASSLLSTAVDDNNYNGSSSARRSSAAGRGPPASGDGSTTSSPVDERNNLSHHHKSSNNNDNSRAKQRSEEEKVEEVQNHQNDKTTKDMRQEISQRSKKRGTLDSKSLAGDTLNNSSRSPSTSAPVTVNDARTSPSDIENNRRVSKNTNPGPSLRNRRNTPSSQSSNKVTTMATAKAPQEAIERIAVATVESSIDSSRIIMADEDDDLGAEDVNLFCGGDTPSERKERQRSYASEPDDVLVKLPSSELFSGSSQSGAEEDVSVKDPVTVITTNEDVSGEAPATTKSVAENVKVYARAGVDPAATGYPDESPSISTVGVVTASSPPPPPTAPAFLSASGEGSTSQGRSGGDKARGGDFARDHGVPVFVDVTHDDFDSRFGLVAGIEYRGKRKATTGWALNYLCILC